MRDLQELLAAIGHRPAIAVFRAAGGVPHQAAPQFEVEPGLEHAPLEGMPERIDHMHFGRHEITVS